ANIAQTVNVLQAVILPDEEEMILTPTYHAFEMYIPFQDATFVPLESGAMAEYVLGDVSVPHVSGTAALTNDGQLAIGLVNLHARNPIDVRIGIEGFDAAKASGRVLTGSAIDAHNSFDHRDDVRPTSLSADLAGDDVNVSLPARSVSVIILER